MCNPVPLKSLDKGTYFTRKPIEYPTERQVFVRGDYDRSSKRYDCERFSDMCDAVSLKGDTLVYTDFIF